VTPGAAIAAIARGPITVPLVTVAVPSLNQGRFLEQALESIFTQGVEVEVFVADAGSTDGTLEVIRRWEPRLAGWRSHPDAGQAAAINEAIARGTAPYVCWLNSDDWWMPEGLAKLIAVLDTDATAPMAYGRVWNHDEASGQDRRNIEVRAFSERLMAQWCLVAQPGTLIRRSAWVAVGGLDASLHMAMDYDLWWRLYRRFGTPRFIDDVVATNRVHAATKTSSLRREHYREAMAVVRRHYGRVPLKWYAAWPWAVWYRSAIRK
jgi:glycosyltransferase involved in cell wall biosynthesis